MEGCKSNFFIAYKLMPARTLFTRLRLLSLSSIINTLIGCCTIAILSTLISSPTRVLLLSSLFGYFYSIFVYNRIGYQRKSVHLPWFKYLIVFTMAFIINDALTRFLLPQMGSFLITQAFVLPVVICYQWAICTLWVFRVKK